jgi:hypothetical protein
VDSWIQEENLIDGAISKNLKPFSKSFSLCFKNIRLIKQLNDSIFAVKLNTRKSKRRRSEDLSEEESDFEIGSIDRTDLIRKEIYGMDGELNEIEINLLHELRSGALIKIPCTLIKYYCDTIPATQNYFKIFKDLFAETKKLFHNRERLEYIDRKRYFFVNISEIIDNDLDLSYNRYKEYEYDEQTYELPKEILSKLISLEKEILFDMNELIELIG